MQKQSFMRADEVAQELGISKSHAYKVIHELNEELQEKGYLTISGRVNREFFINTRIACRICVWIATRIACQILKLTKQTLCLCGKSTEI